MKEKKISVSDFRTCCVEMLREVERKNQSLPITLRGKSVARVDPVVQQRKLDALSGECTIHVDLLDVDFDQEWEGKRCRKSDPRDLCHASKYP